MSTLTDERVVQMKFDNKSFNKNIKDSTSALDKLKDSLNLNSSAKSLNRSLDSVQARFSLWEKASFAIVERITNRIIDMGINMTKSLSIDNISSGWDKFNDNIKLTSTLMAQGFNTDSINEAIRGLEEFSDATSYSTTAMTSAMQIIANSTNMTLEESSKLVKGFANQMAAAGASIQEFSGASNMLTKAISQGHLSGMAFKSLNENYKIITNEFKDQAIQAALAQGTLIETAEGLYQGMESTTQYSLEKLFSEGLSNEKWLTTDVLKNMYSQYAEATELAQQYADRVGMTLYEAANEFQEVFKYAEDNTVDLQTAMKALGKDIDELKISDKAQYQMLKLSMNAFTAAQECRTLADALNAIRDEVSTGWQKSFKYIFGEVDEVKELWGGVYDALSDIFVNHELRNEALKFWNDAKGRDDLFNADESKGELGALFQLFEALNGIVTTFRETFNEVFFGAKNPEASVVGKILSNVTSKLQIASKTLNNFIHKHLKALSNVLKALFNVIKFGGTIIKFVWTVFKSFTKGISPLTKLLGLGSGGLARAIDDVNTKFSKWIKSTTLIDKATRRLTDYSQRLADKIKNLNVIDKISKGFDTFKNKLKSVWDYIKKLNISFKDLSSFVKSVGDAFTKTFNKIVGSFSTLKINEQMDSILGTKSIKESRSKIDEYKKELEEILSNPIDDIAGDNNYSGPFQNALQERDRINELRYLIKQEEESLKNTTPYAYKLKEQFVKLVDALQELSLKVMPLLTSMIHVISRGLDLLAKFFDKFYDKWLEIKKRIGKMNKAKAIAIVGVIASVLTLAMLVKNIVYILQAPAIIGESLLNISRSSMLMGFASVVNAIANVLKVLAICTAVLVAAIEILGHEKTSVLVKGGIVVGAIVAVLLGFIVTVTAVVGHFAKELTNTTKEIENSKETMEKAGVAGAFGWVIFAIGTLMTSLSIAVLALTASIKLIGGMSKEELIRGGVTVGGLIIALAGFVAGVSWASSKFEKINEDGFSSMAARYKAIASLLIGLSASLLLISAAIKIMSAIKPAKLVKSILAFAAVLVLVTFAVKILNTNIKTSKEHLKGKKTTAKKEFEMISANVKGMAGQLISLGLAMLLLTAAIKKFSKMRPALIWKGIAAVSAIIIMLAASMKIMNTNISTFNKLSRRKQDRTTETSVEVSDMAIQILALGATLLMVVQAIKIIGKMNPGQVLGGLITFGTIIFALGLFFKGINTNVKFITKESEADKTRSTFELTSSLVSDMAKQITGIGIALIAIFAALFIFKKLSPSDLAKGLISLTIILTTLGKFLKTINTNFRTISKEGNKSSETEVLSSTTAKIQKQITAVGLMIMGIAGALYLLRNVKPSTMIAASASISAALVALMIVLKIFNSNEYKKVTDSLNEKQYKAGLLSGETNATNITETTRNISQGLIRMGIVMLTVAVALGMVTAMLVVIQKNIKNAKLVITVLLAMAAVMLSISTAVSFMGHSSETTDKELEKNGKKVDKASKNWAVTMLKLIKKFGPILTMTGALTGAVGVLVKYTDKIPWSAFFGAIFKIGAMFGLLATLIFTVVGTAMIFKDLDVDYTSLYKLIPAILAIAAAMGIMGALAVIKIPFKQALTNLVVAGLLFLEMGALMIGLQYLSKMLDNSINVKSLVKNLSIVLVVIGVMSAIVLGLATLSKVSFKQIGKSIVILAASLVTLAAAAVVIAFISKILAPSVSVLLSIGIVLLTVAASVAVFAGALWLLSSLDIEKITENIIGLTKMLKEQSASLGETMKSFFTAMMSAIIFALYSSTDQWVDYISYVIDVLVENAPVWADKLLNMVIAILTSLEADMPIIIDKLINIFISIVNGVTARAAEIVDSVFTLITTILEESLKWLTTNGNAFMLRMINILWNGIWDAVTNIWTKIGDIGKRILDGILEGFTNFGSKIKNACKKVKDGIKDFFNINSPSRLMRDEVGVYLTEGIAEGMKDGVDSLDSACNVLSNTIADGIDDEFVVRPIMDLSEIQNGTSEMQNMFDKNNNFAVSGTANIASGTARSIGSVGTGNISNDYSTQTFNINTTVEVNGADTQNIDELATAVSDKLYKQITGKNAFVSTVKKIF